MINIAIPALLVSIVMIAGIFAFMPIDMATTVHTTVQGTQLNNIIWQTEDDLTSNMTATCSGSTDFLVHYTFKEWILVPTKLRLPLSLQLESI